MAGTTQLLTLLLLLLLLVAMGATQRTCEISCQGSSRCIPFSYICDGGEDCSLNGEDEDPELCKAWRNNDCSRGRVRCRRNGYYSPCVAIQEYCAEDSLCSGDLDPRICQTVGGRGETVTSPGYPNNYRNEQFCMWNITAPGRDDTLVIECSDFDLPYSWMCLGDRMMIFEGGTPVLRAMLCGPGRKSFVSSENNIVVVFSTNSRGTRKGFSCLVRSVPGTTLSSSSTEYTTFSEYTTFCDYTSEAMSTDSSMDSETTEAPTTLPTDPEACTCGVANLARIVGGYEVDPQNKYPWQVGIKMEGNASYWCGGSIINDKFVMTAAHCVVDSRGNVQSARGLVVGVSDHNMYSTDDDVTGLTRLVAVEQVIAHPRHSPATTDNDIALLKLKETLDLSQHKELRAVCLPADDSKTYEGKTATASGWGTLSAGGQQPAKLQEVSVPILSPSCWGMQGITERMLCAGLEEGGKDTCQGDSGGPLYVRESSKYVQIGITSWGAGCADRNSPGVYARVSKFLDWIKSNTADATYCQ